MNVQLDDLKNSLRIDSTADDGLLTGYLLAAELYIKNAVSSEVSVGFWTNENVQPLMTVCTLALASGYYISRTPLSQTQLYPIDLSVNSIIGQLRGLADTFLVESEVVTNGD